MKAKINIDEYKTSGLKTDSLLHFGTIAKEGKKRIEGIINSAIPIEK